MLILRHAVFLHVPKTGGSWVVEALKAAGVESTVFLADGDPHGDLSYCPHPDRFKFAFVRHPVSVYSSYWRYKAAAGWDANNPFDFACASPSFDAFVRKVLASYPGWCSRMFEDYVGAADREIEFVGRYERLADDLVKGLTLAGESFDEAALRDTAPVNVSRIPAGSVRWSEELRQAVLQAEADAVRRFGYAAAPLEG